MDPRPPITMLIVDRSNVWGLGLRTRLRELGLRVFSVRTHKEAVVCAAFYMIDAAVVDPSVEWAADLRKILVLLDVPYIYGAARLPDGLVKLTGCDDEIFGALEGVAV
jgi:hypothetical protein